MTDSKGSDGTVGDANEAKRRHTCMEALQSELSKARKLTDHAQRLQTAAKAIAAWMFTAPGWDFMRTQHRGIQAARGMSAAVVKEFLALSSDNADRVLSCTATGLRVLATNAKQPEGRPPWTRREALLQGTYIELTCVGHAYRGLTGVNHEVIVDETEAGQPAPPTPTPDEAKSASD